MQCFHKRVVIVKKKKTIIISIICGFVMLSAVIGILLYLHFIPYIQLRQMADQLLNKQYEYVVEGKVEGMNLKLLGNSFEGTIKGEKSKDVISGDLIYRNSTYLKIYADKQGNVVFDVGPLVNAAVEKAADSSPFIGGFIKSISGDVKISYDQIEKVLDRKITSLKEEGVSKELMDKVIHGSADDTLTLLKEVEEADKLLGDDGYYFEIDLKDYNTKLVIGIPKNKNDTKWSMNVYTNEITWSFLGRYEMKNVKEIKMPKCTVSEQTIDILKALYSTYLEITNK
ncbi:hypothetical protein DW642_07730 [Blautia sp. AM23-13AC]|nr:hypothetical protein DW642_07730 [Blautia sp. AM23-13AC]